MKTHNRRYFIYGATSLAAMPLVPSSILRAASIGKQDIINGPWTHESESIGLARDVSGVWNQTTDPDNPSGGTTWEIVDDNPMIPNTKQFRTTLVDIGTGHFRTERSEGREPRTTSFPSVGGGHFAGPEKYWYGFLMRIDRADDFDKGHWCQWHNRAAASTGGKSPPVALTGRGSGLEVRLEDNPDNSGNTYHSGTLPELTRANVIGITHAIIWEIYWDTRSAAQGSRGILRLYLDDNPSPVFEWVNKGNCHNDGAEGSPPRVPFFKYGLYKSNLKNTGTTNDKWVQNYTNYVVHGNGADRQGVLDSLLWDLVDASGDQGDIVRPNAPTLLDTT